MNKTRLQIDTSKNNAKRMGLRNYGRKLSEEHRKKISEGVKRIGSGKWMIGKKHSEETRRKMSLLRIGHKCLPETREKIGAKKRDKPLYAMRGEKHPNWKGGIERENGRLRKSLEYRLWRDAVLKRDNYICRFCGKRGGKLQVDHIKPFASYPELRFAIDNGRTLCISCHRKTPTWGFRGNNHLNEVI